MNEFQAPCGHGEFCGEAGVPRPAIPRTELRTRSRDRRQDRGDDDATAVGSTAIRSTDRQPAPGGADRLDTTG